MSNSMEQDPRLADELGKHRLAPSSLDLQDRVLSAARRAMEAREPEIDDVSWKFPVFRFAVCLMIAALLIFAGNLAGDHVIAQWQASSASLDRPTSDTTSIAGLADPPFMVRLAASDPSRSQSVAREQLLNYRRQVQELLGRYQ
jgi:hypothetical protein